MTIKFTMPVEQEEKYENSKGSFQSSVSLYKPLPAKSGHRFVNEVFIPLFDPSQWSLFNRTSEEREALGLHDHNPLTPIGAEAPLYTFYFKVFVHTVKDFVREDGSSGFAQLICPNHFNSYLTKAMGRRPFFKEDKCARCVSASRAWGDYNERWKEIEQERGIKKSEISPDGRREIGENDAILKEAYGRAKDSGVQEKTVLNIFDYGKFSGTRPKDVEDEALAYQTYFSPKKVFEDLKNQWVEDTKDNNIHFFSFENPSGMQVMKIIKSTEECRGNNLRDTKYSILKGNVVKLEDAWASYLTSLDSMVDPSDLLHVVSYENMSMYANNDQQETSYNNPSGAPQQAAPQTPVVPPQAPQQAAPQAPVVPPQAPPAPAQAPVVPTQTAPSVPQVAPGVPTPPAPAQAPPQVPQVPTQAPPAPPTASGAVPAVPTTAVPVVPTSEAPVVPDRTPPSGAVPVGQDFNW